MKTYTTDEFMKELCLPERARAKLESIVFDSSLCSEEMSYHLDEMATQCFDQEPLHPRYDANRWRFPHANESFIKASEQYWAERGCTPEEATSVETGGL